MPASILFTTLFSQTSLVPRRAPPILQLSNAFPDHPVQTEPTHLLSTLPTVWIWAAPPLNISFLKFSWPTQVRQSRYGPEFRNPLVDKEHYRKPETELNEEEKYDQELKQTQLIKAAPEMTTCSVFADPVISKFTNTMMKAGNKILARSLVNQTLEAVKRKQLEKYHAASAEEQATIEHNPYTIFHQALNNYESVTGLVPILRGGHFHQVPVPLPDRRRRFLVTKWMIAECRDSNHQPTLMPEKLSRELLQASHNWGPVIKRKQDMHKMAEANHALAHYC
ncbi:28S ribosomal protein S7, mitochondrial [Heterocephalus glaber]|uniref:Small ribosomal subunit protein uS7m n=1 Tax=Heterocephalus glaber TaxID=10181 RepID=G5B316_HETGA|nr:28S ribosomal protein S7, mitochondrial [Heterocephalus glaber]